MGLLVELVFQVDAVDALFFSMLQVSKMIVTGFLLWCGKSWMLVKHMSAYL